MCTGAFGPSIGPAPLGEVEVQVWECPGHQAGQREQERDTRARGALGQQPREPWRSPGPSWPNPGEGRPALWGEQWPERTWGLGSRAGGEHLTFPGKSPNHTRSALHSL